MRRRLTVLLLAVLLGRGREALLTLPLVILFGISVVRIFHGDVERSSMAPATLRADPPPGPAVVVTTPSVGREFQASPSATPSTR